MVLDDEELNVILEKLAKKIGVKLDQAITINDLMKKVSNQNLYYEDTNTEINVFKPGIKSAFFLKNTELIYDKKETDNFDHDTIVGATFVNKNTVKLTDFNGRTIQIKHGQKEGENKIKVKIKNEISLDLYFKLFN